MKRFKFLLSVLFVLIFASSLNAATATKSYTYSGSLTSGQTKTHTLSIPYDGTLALTVYTSNSSDVVVAYVKNSGTLIIGTNTTGSAEVSAGSTLSIQVMAAHVASNTSYYRLKFKLTYTPNSAPVISSISATPSSTTYGNSVTVKVSATDADGNLSYVKFVKGSSSVTDSTSPYSQAYSGLAAGSHSVTAYAVDTNAASDDASVSFTVNKRPISVKANSGTSIQGASPSNPGLTLTSGSMAYSQSLSGIGLSNSFGITSSSPVGSYTLTVNGSPANYAVTKTAGVWVVQSGNITETDADGDGIDDNMEKTLCNNLTTLTASNLTKPDADGDLYSNIVERLGGASDSSFTSGTSWGSSSAPGSAYSGLTLITPTGIVLSINTSDLTVN